MKVLSIEFSDTWSWGLIFSQLKKHMDIEFSRQFFYDGKPINTSGVDMVLCQNVTLLKKFKERLKTCCRMGGNLNFDNMDKIEPLLKEMSECYCLIATNQKLYEIAKSVNDRVYLVPNGIDLDEWDVIKNTEERPFTVGFCGNISTPAYREYKGYDIVEKACNKANVKLKTALYKSGQIPHEKMRELFYGNIDCIVHPTLGEGCSNTLMEASACGVPIITTKCAGLHGELLKEGKDVLFCARTVKSIQKAIEQIKNDKNLRTKLSKGSRAFAVKNHDVNIIAEQYEQIFDECYKATKGNQIDIEIISTTYNDNKAIVIYKAGNNKPQIRSFPESYTENEIKASIDFEIKANIKIL